MQWIWIGTAALSLVAVLFFDRKMKAVSRLVFNAVLGSLGILAMNTVVPAGMAVGLNVLTVFVVGLLGVPGFFTLFAVQWLIQ